MGDGITGGSFERFNNQITSIGVSALFSWGNPVAVASSFITHNLLQTKIGKSAVSFVANEIYDDAFGFHPSTAHVLATLDLSATGSNLFEGAFSGKWNMADPLQTRDFDLKTDGHLLNDPKGYYPFGRIPGGKGNKGFPGTAMKTLIDKNGNALAVLGKGKVEWGPFAYLPGSLIHTGAIAENFSSNGIRNIAPEWAYGTLFGTCHQAANATLLNAGIGKTVMDIYPHWSTYTTTFVYGNYGGGLMSKVYEGVQADEN